jgi:hypothetical protein
MSSNVIWALKKHLFRSASNADLCVYVSTILKGVSAICAFSADITLGARKMIILREHGNVALFRHLEFHTICRIDRPA